MQKAPYLQRGQGLHVDAIVLLIESMLCASAKRKYLP